MNESVQKTMEALRRNRMAAYYVSTAAQVRPLVESMLEEGNTVAVGGSVTLQQTGVLELLRSEKYHFLDRYAPDLTEEQRQAIFCATTGADVFCCSSNAITENGELYNVDGFANRVAALAFGPKKVIVVAGVNKIVPDLPAAVRRVKTVAAPLNAQRLHRETYCAKTGHCVHPDGGLNEGCSAEQRICCSGLVSARQLIENRIHVILVDENLGY